MSGRSWGVRLAMAVLVLACRVSLDGSDEPEAVAAQPVGPSTEDTLRVACEPTEALARTRAMAVPDRVSRLLDVDGELVAGLEGGGAGRVTTARYEPVREKGRDFAAHGHDLLALVEDRIEVARLDGSDARRLEARPQDVSIAVAGGALHVHSPYDENALVVRRRLADGGLERRLLPVERNLALALLTDVEGLAEDTGIVRGDDRRLAFVPWVRDPVAVLDVASGRWTLLELAEGARGRIRIEELESSEERACPDCTRRIRKTGRRIVRRLYGGAHLDGDALWLVRIDPPGGPRAELLRIELGGHPRSVRAWRLDDLGSPPTAVLRHGDEILVGGERTIRVFERPAPGTGTRCDVSGD